MRKIESNYQFSRSIAPILIDKIIRFDSSILIGCIRYFDNDILEIWSPDLHHMTQQFCRVLMPHVLWFQSKWRKTLGCSLKMCCNLLKMSYGLSWIFIPIEMLPLWKTYLRYPRKHSVVLP